MKKNRGFTLVELIVVLVILAILAAILVPALLGYIDKAKEKQDIYAAKACLDAAQAALAEEYGKGNGVKNYNVVGATVTTGGNKDVRAEGTDVAKAVKELTDEDPYIFMVAMGNCNKSVTSKHDMYTVYYACYVKEKDSRPYYYYNGSWTVTNPTYKNNSSIIDRKTNKVQYVDRELYLQYYVLCNKDNLDTGGDYKEGNFWYYLKEKLQPTYDN